MRDIFSDLDRPAPHYHHTSHIGQGNGVCANSTSRWSDTRMSVFCEVLHTKEGFTIRSNDISDTVKGRLTNNMFPSVIQHDCFTEHGGGRTVRKIWQGTWSAELDGECQRCHVKIPDELLALWKLHNWGAFLEWSGGQHG